MVKRDTIRGFTLIELLLVISIVSLLISVTMPVLSKARNQARRAACGINEKQMYVAQQLYSLDNRGMFPANQVSMPGTVKNYAGLNGASVNGKAGLLVWSGMKDTYIKDGKITICPALSSLGEQYSDAKFYRAPSFKTRQQSYGGWNGKDSLNNGLPPQNIDIALAWLTAFDPKANSPQGSNTGLSARMSAELNTGSQECVFPINQAQCTEQTAVLAHQVLYDQRSKRVMRDWGHGGTKDQFYAPSLGEALKKLKSTSSPSCWGDGHVEVISKPEIKPRASWSVQGEGVRQELQLCF